MIPITIRTSLLFALASIFGLGMLAGCTTDQGTQQPYLSPGANPTPLPGIGEAGGSKGGEQPIKAPLSSADWAPIAGDAQLERGEATVAESGLLPSTQDQQVASLFISGTLPTPCHKLRVVVSEPDEQGQIQVEVYSVYDPNEMCIQTLGAFLAEVPLEQYVSGGTTVFVNGEQISE